MAIERLTPDPAPDIEDMSTSQDTTSVEEEQIVDVIEGAAVVSTIGGTITISRVQQLGEKKVEAGDVLKIGDMLS